MGGGSSQQESSGTSTQINQIPEWMSQAGQQNYAFAQKIAEQPLQQYQGQMVADVAPQTQQAWNVAANSGNVGADQFNAATAGYLGALGQTPMQVANPGNAAAVTAGNIGSTNLQPYMDPYTQSVINTTLPIMQQNLGLQQNQQQNAANAANAFGGSRQGVQQGVTQAQGAQNMAQMAAGLNQANFQQAQAAATGDINRQYQAAVQNQQSQQTDLARQFQAQQLNQAAQQAKINSDIAASQGLTSTGTEMGRANAANFNMLQSAGAGESMQAQNQINAQMAKFNQAFNYPQQQLGTLLSALGMTPHDTSTSGQETKQTTTTTPTDWAGIISQGLGAAGNLYGMFTGSDRSMKTDITPLGKDPSTGVPMHAFRYKGDPKSYPKVVGPMAQDVAKIDPDAVAKIGSKSKGKMAIRGYAAGTPFVQPSLAPFLPKSSPGVATGIGALSAFRPPVKLPRGATIPAMPKRFKFGTPNVGPNNGPYFGGGGALAGPASQDSVPAMLTPGEAVLTGPAADAFGRHKIAALNAMMPPTRGPQATSAPRAGARGLQGALANTKLRPKLAGGLAGG